MHMHMHMHMPYQAHAHTHTHALPMQGVPGWPEIYGLGCCEYRLNATHAAPLVVDARQPLQTAPMWNPLPGYEIQYRRTQKKKKTKQLAEGASQDQSKASYRVRVRAEASRDPNPS